MVLDQPRSDSRRLIFKSFTSGPFSQHHYRPSLRGSGGVQVASATLETRVLLGLSLKDICHIKLHNVLRAKCKDVSFRMAPVV